MPPTFEKNCTLCQRVQRVINSVDACCIVSAKTLVSGHGFTEEDARAGMLAFKNCDDYPRGCPKEVA